jgi:hypothetical protein
MLKTKAESRSAVSSGPFEGAHRRIADQDQQEQRRGQKNVVEAFGNHVTRSVERAREYGIGLCARCKPKATGGLRAAVECGFLVTG